MLLKVNPSDRPTCAQILKHPIIKKRLEFFKANANIEDIDNIDEGVLLQTIRIPKNVLFLADKLPGSNYNKKNKNLPDIKLTEGNDTTNNKNSNGNNHKMKSNPNLNNQHVKLNSKSIVQKENNNTENLNEDKKEESQENSRILKDQKIKIIKEEDGLPNLEKDKIDINPINSQRKIQLQKRAIQNKKELEYQKYLQSLGLGDIYKVNYLNLGNNNNNSINRINKQQQQRNRYGNYLPGIYKNKRNNSNSYSQNYNSNNINNKSSRIIPNKRLNPINKGLGIKILY
jgi:hypothetical protein